MTMTNKKRLRLFKEWAERLHLTTVLALEARPLVPNMSWQEAQEIIAKLEESRRYISPILSALRKLNPEIPEHRCVECGEAFLAGPGAKTCSDRCRQRLSRRCRTT